MAIPSGTSVDGFRAAAQDTTPEAPIGDPAPGPPREDPGPHEPPAEDPSPAKPPVEDPTPEEPPRRDPPLETPEPGQPPPMIKDPPAPDAAGSIDPRVFTAT